jgi:hypothetical protein
LKRIHERAIILGTHRLSSAPFIEIKLYWDYGIIWILQVEEVDVVV